MTRKELVMERNPKYFTSGWNGVLLGCPDIFSYLLPIRCCKNCEKCWNTEIKEDNKQ